MEPKDRMDLMLKIGSSFSPSAPINQQSLFAGRIQQFLDVTTAVNQRGQHVILFGERGVGKTSLSSVIAGAYKQQFISAKVNCDQSMTFSELWRKLFREIPISSNIQGIGFTAQASSHTNSLADYLPPVVTPDDVRHILQRLSDSILIIDELDRIDDSATTTMLADTIKTLSDHSTPTTIILVGVADSVTSLIQEHQSIERALVQIRMPRMSLGELNEIIDKGMQNAGMTVEPRAKHKISTLSQGLPHYTHLLSLHAAQKAAQRGSTTVTAEDVTEAIQTALQKAQQSTISSYHKATSSSRENLYPQVLLACAMAKPDALGYFSAADVRGPLSSILSKTVDIPAFSQHLNAFCNSQRGPILQRTGEIRRFRYRFINPLMQPYVVMDGLKRELIKEADLS